MRLLELSLTNIRSYRATTVQFSSGITLLSGDIGAGKSTLLLAIEFAFFGISRELPGSALLRYGEEEASVTLTFAVDHTYTIHRRLKRTVQGIVQAAGWLETDGQRTRLTPNELKARVFTILGYPLHTLGKKNMLYRCTMYTPQEEMKQILTGERVEVIRRIFGIDAYKTIRENAYLTARAFHERLAKYDELLTRITTEKHQIALQLKKLTILKEQHAALAAEKEVLATQLVAADTTLTTTEAAVAQAREQRQLHALNQRTRSLLEQELARYKQHRAEKQTLLDQITDTIKQMHTRMATFSGQTATAQELHTRLSTLQRDEGKLLALIEADTTGPATGTCPTCKQIVSAAHVASVQQATRAQQEAATKKRTKLTETMATCAAALRTVQERHDLQQRLTSQEEAAQIHTKELARLDETITAKSAEYEQLPVTKTVSIDKEETAHAEAHTAVAKLREDQRAVEQRLASVTTELDLLLTYQEKHTALEEDLHTYEWQRKDAQATRAWLLDRFVPFTETVERHVLVALYTTFNAAFQQWFAKLVDAAAARIDQTFTPLVQQHGYDVELQHLSGGERTAVSLAYRLALVHTIHTLLPELGTAGLIMLDEPTDGFSTEQLVCVRDVLRELNMEQIILVSHEQQLEGFVDHIIRVEKAGESLIQESL